MVKKGTLLQTDGNSTYLKIVIRNFTSLKLQQVAHWEENHEHKFLADLNKIVGNLKNWYRGTHHHFNSKNTAYYLNEFAYRFNRRRTEFNIFDRLLSRSVKRIKMLTYENLIDSSQYLPLVA